VTTERILSKERTAEMGHLRRALGVTLHDKEYRFLNPQISGFQATSPNREIPAILVRPCVQNVPVKIAH